jgi:N-methylhydantoinase A
MHAAETAAEIGVTTVIVPQFPGNLSALGLLSSELRSDYSLPFWQPLATADWSVVNAEFEKLFERGKADFQATGIKVEAISGLKSLDARYTGQAFELTIPFAERELDAQLVESRFIAEYIRQYGHVQDQSAIEIVALRMVVKADIGRPAIAGAPRRTDDIRRGVRKVYFGGSIRETPVFHRGTLDAGFNAEGPVIIEEFGSTTIVPPSWGVSLQSNGNIMMTHLQ